MDEAMLNGVIALFTAMSYAELSSAIPRAGGGYNFARIGFGRGPSFIAGWLPVSTDTAVKIVAFKGFEVIAQAGDETVEPKKPAQGNFTAHTHG